MGRLHYQWMDLCVDIGQSIPEAEGLYADLQSRYGEPWRSYRSLDHIEFMLAEFDAYLREIELDPADKGVVRMAVWYHHVVHNPQAKDNKEKSVALFRQIAERKKWSSEFVAAVSSAMLATKHDSIPHNLLAGIVCDLDLCILGRPRHEFEMYELKIREEYEGSISEFCREHVGNLQSFLDRPSIYSQEFFKKKLEERARENLAQSIKQLSARLNFKAC